MDERSQWLTPAEQRAWRGVIRMYERLGGRLARGLQSESRLSGSDYAVLVKLVEAPDGRMRHAELTKGLEWEKSRMSHQISRMVKRGLVVRRECPEDGRGAFVVITPEGREVIAEAAPRRVEAVRRLSVDPLTPEELRTFARVADRVVERLQQERC